MNLSRVNQTPQLGMTLVELSVVLLILIALAGISLPYLSGSGHTAMCQATDATMQTVKQAIMGGPAGAGYYADTLGTYPADRGNTDYNLKYLFVAGDGSADWPPYNPQTGVGWRGPYLQTGATLAGNGGNFADANYTSLANGDGVVSDAWGRPLVLQVPAVATCDELTGRSGTNAGECARLVSAGPGTGLGMGFGDIDTRINNASSTSTEAHRANDDRILYLRIPTPANDAANSPCDNP